MGHNICTVTDYGYLTRVILLLESVFKHETDCRFFLLATDDKSYDIFSRIKDDRLVVFSLDQLEDSELTAARETRNWIEWIWLFQPALPLYIMENYDVEHVFWMDGDMWLFHKLDGMYAEIGDSDVAISPHRFSVPTRAGDIISVHNGGATYFRNSEKGRACCTQWKTDCIEWNYWYSQNKPGNKQGQKGGTQGYLDFWPENWDAHVVQHLGCNLAPWNQDRSDYNYSKRGDALYINNQRLLFYHFQDCIPERRVLAGSPIVPFVETHVYQPYLEAYRLKLLLWQPSENAKDPRRKA